MVPGEEDDGGGGAPPSPLSMEWIERELLEGRARGGTMEIEDDNGRNGERATTSRPRQPAPSRMKDAATTTITVKDLDAKIRMLREREEEVVRANEERRKRIEEEEEREAVAAAEEEEAARRMAAAEEEEEEARRMEIEMARQRLAADAARMPSDEREMAGRDQEPKRRTVVDVARARQQPKSTEEERMLQEKYGKMEDLEERAFSILVDLGMVDLHSDPAKISTLDSEDDD